MTQQSNNDNDSTVDDLAAVGARLGDDGHAWRTALRAFAAYGIDADRDPTDPEVKEVVAGQVYATLHDPDPAATEPTQEFVETFVEVYDLDDGERVATLLDREPFDQDAYEGRLAFQGNE